MSIPVLNEAGQIADILYLSEKKYEEIEHSITEMGYKAQDSRPINEVLVIGGAGYLGSILSKKLIETGYTVRVLDNLMYGDLGIKKLYGHPKFEFVNGDMRNLQIVVILTTGKKCTFYRQSLRA